MELFISAKEQTRRLGHLQRTAQGGIRGHDLHPALTLTG